MSELKPTLSPENQTMAEVLQLYQELPCLWDTRHSLYDKRDVRAKAFELLLNKYKMICPDAGVDALKKKLESMRKSYRRERNKILHLAKFGQDRMPSLWYYDYLKFLDEENDQEFVTITDELKYEDDRVESEESLSAVYLTEAHLDSEEENNDPYFIQYSETQNDTAINDSLAPMTEAEAFGRTIALQLNELQPEQRYIAEKLISEVIYHARFEKLDVSTRLSNV